MLDDAWLQQEVHKIVVSVDDSDCAKRALEWAIQNSLGPNDELHIISVALPVPYPVGEGNKVQGMQSICHRYWDERG